MNFPIDGQYFYPELPVSSDSESNDCSSDQKHESFSSNTLTQSSNKRFGGKYNEDGIFNQETPLHYFEVLSNILEAAKSLHTDASEIRFNSEYWTKQFECYSSMFEKNFNEWAEVQKIQKQNESAHYQDIFVRTP